NGLSAVDDGWFERAAEGEVLGVPVLLCPPEEVLWTKAFIMERERYDGADVAHLLLAAAPRLDWKLLLYRFGDDWRVLLAHLVLFGYIFPSERNRVPREVMEVLLARLAHEVAEPPPFERVCQGTLLSRGQYLVDVEERGFEDGRLRPDVEMTAEDIAHWTSAIPEADRPTQRLVENGDGASPSARSPGSAPPCYAGHEAAVAGVDRAAREPARAGGAGAVHRVEEPLVRVERAVEPEGVVEAGRLHRRLEERAAVRQQRRPEQPVVRAVGEDGPLHPRHARPRQ